MDEIRFYFSFRSPYAWLATERLEEELGDLGAPIKRIPIYPSPDNFPNDPTLVRNKARYLVHDVIRLAGARGLTLKFPEVQDPDWSFAHGAALGIGREDEEAGHRLSLEIFRQRWCEGADVGQEEVLAAAARKAEVDESQVITAARDGALRAEAADGWRLAGEKDHVFGVPSFVFGKDLYWGQDRMAELRQAIVERS